MRSPCPRLKISVCLAALLAASPGTAETARRISSFFGGNGSDYANAIACDSAGNVYVVGCTYSWDFPVPEGEDPVSPVGGSDIVVAKLSPALDAVLATTVLGGSGDDEATSVDIAADGRVIVTGWATAGFPTTAGAFQTENAGGKDIVVAAFDPDLVLVYSTFLGGASDERVFHARLDDRGVVTVVGYTLSSQSFPLKNPFQSSWGGGTSDSIVAQILPDGTAPATEQLVYSTLIGGSGDDWQDGSSWSHDVSPAPDGRIAAFIHTASSDLPTLKPYQASRQGDFDAYLCVLDPAHDGAAQLTCATYYGGSANDAPKCVRWLGDHTLALVGWTFSALFPRTDGSLHRGTCDAFASILDFEGPSATLVYGTLIGGASYDTPIDTALTPDGDLLVVGRTISGDFPAVNAMSPFRAGVDQGFVFALKPGASPAESGRLWFSSSFGGSGSSFNDYACQVVPHTSSGAWIATGYTGAWDFPTTPGVVGPTFAGGAADFFITEFDLRFPSPAMSLAPSAGTAPLDVGFDASSSTTPAGTEPLMFAWDFGDGETGEGMTPRHTYTTPGRCVVTLAATNAPGLSATASEPVTVACAGGDVSPWTAADIGSPLFPGSAWKDGEGISVCAGGRTTISTADEFHYVHQEAARDFSAVVRVEEQIEWIVGARLGLMARGSADPGAPFAALLVQKYSSETRLLFRFRDAGVLSARSHGAITLPLWLQIVRHEQEVVALSSPDGEAWTEVDRQVIAFGSDGPVLGGLAACGNDTGDPLRSFTPLRAHVSGLGIAFTATFRRGDANADGKIDIADAVFLLGHLFAEGPAPSCEDAGDANDDGRIDIADAIKILGHLFASAGPLPAPFGACDIDPTEDELRCVGFVPCEQE